MDKRRIKYGLAAFIDLLGFSEKVQAVESEIDLAGLEATIRAVQKRFEHRPTDKFQKLKHRLAAKTVLAFTDCVVVFVARGSQLTKSHGEFDALAQELSTFGLNHGECVLRGHLLRGGVAMGYWYKVGDTLISSAQVAAHKVESTKVCVPMIGIEDELYEFLANHPGRRCYSEDTEPVKRTFIQYVDQTTGKKAWLIDYFRICLESVDGDLNTQERIEYEDADADRRDEMRGLAHYRACREFVIQHKAVIEAGRNAVSDPHIKYKYDWLRSYHNKTVKRFFRKDRAPLLIKMSAN